MTVQIALLRAVNVGGRSLAMAELRACAEALGLKQVRSILQSGNLVFESRSLAGGELETVLEAGVRNRFGLAADVLVRSDVEWEAILAANPFGEAAEKDPARMVIMLLKGAPGPAAVERLSAAIAGRETLSANGRELYITYPDGIGASKLTGAAIERALAVRGTARNWNTALKLAAAASPASD
ncbi:MAG: DUF1697 domain-containing protein [Caulobacteraceae bacterium]|nr:DUF1697 domain-containing protein [Caulobacteraceae bacterium]